MSGRILMSTSANLTGTRLALTLFAISLTIATLHAAQSTATQSAAQSSSDSNASSIADAARQSRERAKNATKPSKVISDDDLDPGNLKPGQQGLTVDAPPKLETQPPSPGAVAVEKQTPFTPPDPATAVTPADDPEIKRLKDSIADAEKEAEIARRELALSQDTYYSNPDYAHDTAGKSKLDSLQQEIDAKQQVIDAMKTRLAALQELHHVQPAPAKPADQSGTPQPPTSGASAPAPTSQKP
jgi:hypothetical protein